VGGKGALQMTKNLRNGIVALAVGLGVAAGWSAPASAGDDSPMKSWMKEKLQPAKAAGDYKKVITLLGALATKNPDQAAFPDWKKYADQGIEAAKKEDKEGLNKSCSACHNAYKKLYKEKYRSGAAP
jgi:hypothetical protein